LWWVHHYAQTSTSFQVALIQQYWLSFYQSWLSSTKNAINAFMMLEMAWIFLKSHLLVRVLWVICDSNFKGCVEIQNSATDLIYFTTISYILLPSLRSISSL
jgi:hypothetical protein